MIATLLSVLALAVPSAGPDPSWSPAVEAQAETLELTFGVYQTDKATTLYRQFTPTLEHLQARMEAELERPVDIQLRIYKTYEEGIEALATGAVDFVRFGPASYVTAHARQPYLQLLAMEHKDGEKRFHGVVVVRADSPIRDVGELKGRTFAFGDPNSTIGRYLSQALLLDNGVTADDLGGMAYLGRHDKVALAVAIGDYDAGALKESTLKKVDTDGRLRVLTRFENVTKPWIARAGLEPAVVRALTRALVGVDDAEALEALGVSGFLPTSDEEYAFVRRGMARARRFEGLPEERSSR